MATAAEAEAGARDQAAEDVTVIGAEAEYVEAGHMSDVAWGGSSCSGGSNGC